jgi:hypothetical protein
VVCGDARRADTWNALSRQLAADACVTSPPYLNNFDYADATRLELYFLGRAQSWAEMCTAVRQAMITATTQQSAKASAERDLAWLERFPATYETITALSAELGSERSRRPRGKEYDRVLPSYFRGIARVLSHAHRRLKKSAPTILVIGDSAPYGVYVDTPDLIKELALQVGFSFQSDEVLRPRGSRWRQNGVRHKIELTERLVFLTRD